MKAAIYCRLSEEDRNKRSKEDDSVSIQNQKSMLVQYALDQNWEIYGIYSDDDYTGADRGRPEFKRILQDACQRRFDIILCKTQSRFTRELELVEKYIHGLFPVWGIRFVSIVDNADTENKGNKKARQINGLINEWYLEDMSDNIKSVLTDRRRQGYHIGAFCLYGYAKDPDKKGHLVIDPEAAAVVRRIFTLYADGFGKTAIARLLNAEGIPNPSEYKRQNGIGKRITSDPNGKLWKYYTISDMLRNEMYVGNLVQGKYGSVSYKEKRNKPKPKSQWIRVEHTHDPVVDTDLWNCVQEKLGIKSKPFAVTGKVGLFAGKVRCRSCGFTMRSSKTKGRQYLKCTTSYASKEACKGAFLSVKMLEAAVTAELNSLFSQYLDMDFLEQSIPSETPMKEKEALLQSELTSFEKRYEEYSGGLKELYLDKIKGLITSEEFAALSIDFRNSKESFGNLIKEKRQALDQLTASQTEAYDAALSKRRMIEKYIPATALTRDMVEELIDYISVGRKDPETGERLIEINWNF